MAFNGTWRTLLSDVVAKGGGAEEFANRAKDASNEVAKIKKIPCK